jgi:hypothetical protein
MILIIGLLLKITTKFHNSKDLCLCPCPSAGKTENLENWYVANNDF